MVRVNYFLLHPALRQALILLRKRYTLRDRSVQAIYQPEGEVRSLIYR